MAKSGKFAPVHVSELASALATVELDSGSVRKAKEWFGRSLENPTENSLAQARWAALQHLKLQVGGEREGLGGAFEADSWSCYGSGDWEGVIRNCESWFWDEPFSSRAVTLGSFVATSVLGKFDLGRRFAVSGLRANPNDFALLNNHAFALLMSGDSDRGACVLGKVNESILSDDEIIVFTATKGLLAFRQGRHEVGDKLYRDAITKAKRLPDVAARKRIQALASVFYIRERIRSGDRDVQAVLENALECVKGVTDPAIRELVSHVEHSVMESGMVLGGRTSGGNLEGVSEGMDATVPSALRNALEATGYLVDGRPAADTVMLGSGGNWDACWRSGVKDGGEGAGVGSLSVLFRFATESETSVAEWQRKAWNLGSVALLWVVSRDRIDIYNGFGEPRPAGLEGENLVRTFENSDAGLAELDAFGGRLAMETGSFWVRETGVDRQTAVDRRLYRDLGDLSARLVADGLCQRVGLDLIGRTVLAKYLIDREMVTGEKMRVIGGHCDLLGILHDGEATERFFGWLGGEFHGDVFPSRMDPAVEASHLRRVSRFLGAERGDEAAACPYRFDIMPVELISSVYERLVYSAHGVCYTPVTAVSMVLDQALDDLAGDETVVDVACGSGLFLAEALRRLVRLKANGAAPTREMIRQALHRQVYGVAPSRAAVESTALSLYLAAFDLDPDPAGAMTSQFEPLVGRVLLAGDAQRAELGTKKFDVVVGSSWDSEGRAGRTSLDFIRRSMEFAHSDTRLGVLVNATEFFARSGTELQAAQELARDMEPVTLFNLSGLSHWLFEGANVPAMALLGRHRGGRPGWMELINVPRSIAGDRTRTIGATPADAIELQHASWLRNRDFLKTGFMGRQPDLRFLNRLWQRCAPLDERLAAVGARLASRPEVSDRSKEARHLHGVPFLATGDIGRFAIPADLLAVGGDDAERSRERDTSPLHLLREQGLKYMDADHGVSFRGSAPDVAYLVSGILGSALASWYFLMTGASLGISKPVVHPSDVKALPAPDLRKVVDGEAGRRIVALARRFHVGPPEVEDWKALDDAVFDLYEMNEGERILASDGRLRVTWQWEAGRDAHEEAADQRDLRAYARGFLLSMDAWFRAGNRRRFRATVHDGGRGEPLRVVRFVIEDHPPPSRVVARRHESLGQLLGRIDQRLDISMARELIGGGDLIVHSPREVVVVKPAARRRWRAAVGLEDARAVLARSFAGGLG